jgi:hypothetical protein
LLASSSHDSPNSLGPIIIVIILWRVMKAQNYRHPHTLII